MNSPEYDYDAARQEAAESWRKEQAEERLQRFAAERPPAFADVGTLHPRIAEWTTTFLGGAPGGLVLLGPTGVGKTWSLWKIKEALLSAGFLGSVEICAVYALRRIVAPPLDEAAFNRLADADLLAVDDFGSSRQSDWDADNLHALVDARWSHQRPTILTSNIPDLRQALGERVASRLADGVTVVAMTGEDRRRDA